MLEKKRQYMETGCSFLDRKMITNETRHEFELNLEIKSTASGDV